MPHVSKISKDPLELGSRSFASSLEPRCRWPDQILVGVMFLFNFGILYRQAYSWGHTTF